MRKILLLSVVTLGACSGEIPIDLADVESSVVRPTPTSFLWYAGDDALAHQIGEPYAQKDKVFWRVTDGAQGALTYGPYQNGLRAGRYRVRFALVVRPDGNGAPLFTLDVNDARADRILKERTITSEDVRTAPSYVGITVYDLIFNASGGETLEYRVFNHGRTPVMHLFTQLDETTQPELAKLRGGANLFWYQADGCPPNAQSDFWEHGILRHYHETGVRDLVRTGLATMYKNGQRRLRVGLYHNHGEFGSTALDSTGGWLQPRYVENLRNHLADIKAAGFEQIIFAFFPMGENNPQEHTVGEELFQENWNVIVNARKLLVASGIPYIIDLANEGTPWDNPPMLAYAQRLWSYYTYTFGKADTEGFSIIPIEPCFNNLAKVYGNNYPNVLDLHFYSDLGTSTAEIYPQIRQRYREAKVALDRLGLEQDWIIGETFYDGAAAAQAFADGVRETGKAPLFLLEWPLTDHSCRHVNVDIPVGFSHYINAGF